MRAKLFIFVVKNDHHHKTIFSQNNTLSNTHLRCQCTTISQSSASMTACSGKRLCSVSAIYFLAFCPALHVYLSLLRQLFLQLVYTCSQWTDYKWILGMQMDSQTENEFLSWCPNPPSLQGRLVRLLQDAMHVKIGEANNTKIKQKNLNWAKIQ